MSRQLYRNARVFTADSRRWAEAFVVDGERIAYVGDAATAGRIAGDDAETVDLGGATVLPGFVDGHAHVVGTGEAAQQVDLWGADSVEEIQRRISEWASAHPDEPRIRAQGWAHGAFGGAQPHRAMLDAVVADRPVYAQAYDYHSIWLNTAALAEVGIDAATEAPEGGRIHADAEGPTGLVDETAMHRLVWPFLDGAVTPEDLDRFLASALSSYRELGITASTEMALDEGDLTAMRGAEERGELTARIVAHWRVQPTGDTAQNLAQVERARSLAETHRSPWLRVTGIKVLVDGTVDGCTAALGAPYADGSTAEPVWSLDELAPVVIAADAAGLQVAMHAIGDEAIRIAIGAVEAAIAANGPAERRHRIEHLEVVTPDEIARLAALGITASMQPVHSDPAIQENWRSMLGDARVDRGFPWPEMTQAGARLVFGTDSPTSPQAPLPNMFVAATRRSALDPSLEPNVPAFALPLLEAVEHATRDAAWACRAEHEYGRIAAGLLADFVVLDRDIFAADPEELLETTIVRTVVGGRTVYAR
ncbi:amidohydrolase [Leucobacter ruminantium]|uniref:Amidohydrolase n=1 Tax=Leucobacter ruminantium TaxID=1289170 RepID=A0A939RX30_9MICO|nr:amidohydrolase [Leucobacter ruminantium]MBO1804278.1 amidohydrolase [Leucobacter ruminantium]